ncbi:hypothetical protein B0H13DRAFT_2570601 [Mycena leptocephala]|nr:hypothetical protein B0H13DRAFT_2570601 [Mycena leptocephala]
MPAKFLSLSVVFSALFVSQLVVAIPNVDCSLVRCAAPPQCAFDQPAFLSGQSPRADGTNPRWRMLLNMRPLRCSVLSPFEMVGLLVIAASVAGSTLVTLPGNCCPTCAPPPDCSAVQCLACPDNTVAVTVAGQCCPTCKPKPDCSDVLCVECVGEVEPGNCCPTCGLGAK